MPVRLHRLLVVLHDSGKDKEASSNTAQVSRKASGGIARRVRTRYRNRRKRRLDLIALLEQFGYSGELDRGDDPYAPWQARLDLLDSYVADDTERRTKLSTALLHMYRHRGYASAWVRIDDYMWQEEPSPEFLDARDKATNRSDLNCPDPQDLDYQADLAALAMQTDLRIRPRNPRKPGADAVSTPHTLGVQRRSDVVREWRQICRMQRIPDDQFEALARVAFSQERPKAPAERVGNDWLPGFQHEKRASISSLEHQEFQIRQTELHWV